ncbi:MAG: hypothetical protein AAF789_09315 [Bacteroidota bacterium]
MEEEKASQSLAEWAEGISMSTIGDATLLLVFALFIIILVIRTFRNKASA